VCAKLAWDNLKKQNVLEELEKERAESQLQFLKSQLNPHFLFNNLNNLYSYAQEGSPKTSEIILQLSAIMRYMLYESKENFVDLAKEIQYLGDFIKLQELQMEDRGKVNFKVNGRPQGKLIAPLVLITFVENCFKHSMSGQAKDIEISIFADINEEEIHFRCENTFEPVDNTSNEYLTSGIGLANTRKRLELLYPGEHHLEAGPQEDRYVVDLRLPLSLAHRSTSSRSGKPAMVEGSLA
jgi:two-component system LytT family sensor kinase